MKKRILALALAGTTAFSVFGALNVSAAHGENLDEAFAEYEHVATVTVNGTEGKQWVTVDGESILDVDVVTVMDYDDVMDETVASGTLYFYDFLDDLNDYNDTDYDQDDVEDALEEDEEAGTSRNIAALIAANIGKGGDIDFETALGDKGSIRRAVVDAFEEFIDETSLIVGDYEYLDDDDKDPYNFEGLMEALNDAAENYASMYTSNLIYLMQEYERFIDEEYAVLDEVSSTDYADLLVAILEGRNEEDYESTKAYRGWTADLEDLIEAYEDADTVSEFNAAVTDLKNNVVLKSKQSDSEKADMDALEDAMADTITIKDKSWELYPESDFTDDDDEWTDEYDWYRDVYALAELVYANGKNNNFQGSVDVLTDALEDAEAALVAYTEPKESRLLSLEEWVEEYGDLVEMDYTSKAWGWYTKALAYAEELLAGDPGKEQVMNAVEMVKYVNDLLTDDCTYHVAAKRSQLKELAAAIEDAEDWLDEYDDTAAVSKVLAVTKALENAKEVEDDYDEECVLLHEILDAIDAIDAALASTAVANGWLKTEEGWMYGTESGWATGWQKIGVVYYYFDANGIANESEWMYENGKWYYFTEGCNAVANHWALVDGKWYWFNEDYSMFANGWKWINNKCYYFYADGSMAANTTIDGYVVGADGAWIA